MGMSTSSDSERLEGFWESVFADSFEETRAYVRGTDPEDGWKTLAPSEKLLLAACSLKDKKRVLDYGCGSGWAGIAAAKSGCGNVICADLSASGIKTAAFCSEYYGVSSSIVPKVITPDWLKGEPDDYYDGFICSNVLDVIPHEAALDILKEAARVTSKDASLVIGLNHHMDPVPDPGRGMTVKNGNMIYINGILRMISRPDEEWTRLMERYFAVEKLDHFAWPGETAERRRLFILSKKSSR